MSDEGPPDGSPAPENPLGPLAARPGGSRRSWIVSTISWLRDLMLSVVIAILVILFVYQPVKVEGTSMMPSLEDQERIFINKFVYQFGMGDVQRGDLVVFWYPSDPSKSYIKRVIGLPGDRIEIDNGVVSVNGQALRENYVPMAYRDTQSVPLARVPDDHYFVLGDHRSSSNDSRNWGPVHRRHIYGKAVFVYWPPARMGLIR
jgi:signal peptidase I